MAEGKLIVLEGIDGSGKSSQYSRLCARMENDGIEYNHIVFPRYEKESSALIRMYLGGEFGTDPSDVNAYTASTFFAVDRFASYRTDWGKLYEAGGLVLSDRYTSSNAVHQGSKLSDAKPDLVIYLDVDIETSLARMKHRQDATDTHADIHERNIAYLERCLRTADTAADYFGWTRVMQKVNGVERGMDDINDEIYAIVRRCLQ